MRLSSVMRSAVIGAMALCVAGCLSSNTYQTAEVLKPGDWTVGAAVNVTYVRAGCFRQHGDDDRCLAYESPNGVVTQRDELVGTLPAEGLGRIGIAPHVDMGARVGLVGARVDLKVQTLDTRYFDMALDFGFRADLREVAGYIPLIISTQPLSWLAFFGGVQSVVARWQGLSDEYAIVAGGAVNAGIAFDIDVVSVRPEVTYNNYFGAIDLPPGAYGPYFSYVTMGVGVLISGE
jgi:hypothetical protein